MSRRAWAPKKIFIVASCACALFAAGCDKKEDGTDGGPRPDGGSADRGSGDGPLSPDAGKPPEGVVTFKKAGDEAAVSFAKGDEQYLVVPYSVSTAAADAIAYTVKVTAGAASKAFALRGAFDRPRIDPRVLARWQQRLAVERFTRALAEKAARTPLRPRLDQPIAACTLSSECGSDEVCAAGNCAKSVSVKLAEFSSTPSIDAAVKRKGAKAALLVDAAATVSDADLDALLNTFEKTVLPRNLAFFGALPLKAGSPQPAWDRNGDGLVWVVLTKRVEERNAVGFFIATDFTEDAKSNQADILYAAPPDATTAAAKIFPYLAHELQHLLSYANKAHRAKVGGGQATLEALWLDEGMAHFAEDACGYGGEMTSILDEKLFPTFSEARLIDEKDSAEMRAMAFTFVRYLFEQKGNATYNADGGIADKGGAAWLQSVHASTKLGVDAVSETFGDFKAALDNWVAAIALDGRGVTEYAKWIFAPLVEDPVTKNQVGCKIRGPRKNEEGTEVNLSGPLEEDLSSDTTEGTIPNTAAKLYVLKGKTAGAKISVTSEASDLRFAVIKIK
jgi:hypothetical protein